MTSDEFLVWAEQQPEKHYELFRGEVFKMSAEKADHARAKRRAANLLEAGIKRAGAACEAFVDGLSVMINETTTYEPDALVNCGPRLPGNALFAPSPVIVVEVLSPSTQNMDKTVKVADYLGVPCIAHVLIVDLERRAIHHYRQAAPGKAEIIIVRDGSLNLDPPGLTLAVSDFFDDL